MRGINRVVLAGRIGDDPPKLKTKNGRAYTRLNLATHQRQTADGDSKEITTWHRIQVFGPMAETCCRYIRKGAPLIVEGHLTQYTRHDETLGQRSHTSVVADQVHFLPSVKGSQTPPQGEEVEESIP